MPRYLKFKITFESMSSTLQLFYLNFTLFYSMCSHLFKIISKSHFYVVQNGLFLVFNACIMKNCIVMLQIHYISPSWYVIILTFSVHLFVLRYFLYDVDIL